VSDLCPWDGFTPATISFCEARLCAAIAEPANAFTSLSKTLVGLALIPACLRRGLPALWAIVAAALVQGPLGFALHATGTFWGEALDVSGMFLISSTLLAFSLRRRFGWTTGQLVGWWGGLVVGSVAVLLIVPPSGIAVFSVQVVGWLVLEVSAPGSAVARKWLWWMLACFAAGFAFWIADKTRIVCDPENHVINGHAVWHLATSACLALFFRYEAAMGLPLTPTLSPVGGEG
jgi:hypothetical protein